jgi:Mg2+/Co2+ transporter CorB
MTAADWLAALALLICLLVSGLLSLSETAFSASSRARLTRLQKQGSTRAALALRLLDARERLMGSILVGKTIALIAAASLAAGILLVWFGDVGLLYAIVATSLVVIVFAELLPRTVASRAPEEFALRLVRPVQRMVRLLEPLLTGGEALVRWTMRLFGHRADGDQLLLSAHEGQRGQLEPVHRDNGAEKLDRDMLGGMLNLRDLTVSDVMVHRTEMLMIDADDAPQEIVAAALKSNFTRIPLWRGSTENIIGILHAKDLLRALQSAGGDVSKLNVAALARPAWFVPDIRPLSEQLKAFRRRKTHFALVVDEYGEVEGLVTLEDVLAEIVGDIADEHDVPVPGVRPQPDGSVNVDGSVPIRDLNRAMNWNLPDAQATTIAGLVIHESRSIPDVGQFFTFHGFRFGVLRKERNRITTLRITPLVRKAPPLAKIA